MPRKSADCFSAARGSSIAHGSISCPSTPESDGRSAGSLWSIRRTISSISSGTSSSGKRSPSGVTRCLRCMATKPKTSSASNGGTLVSISWSIAPDGVDVRAAVDHLAADLLGRHVLRRAEDDAGLGLEAAVHLLHVAGDELRHAEVEDLGPLDAVLVDVDADVVGLHVAVDDALVVGGAQRAEELRGDVARTADGHRRLARDHLLEAVALDQLHRDVGEALVGGAGAQDADGRVVPEAGRGPGLALEARHVLARLREVLVQHLDRSGLARRRVGRVVHRPHRALAERRSDLEALAEQRAGRHVAGGGDLGLGHAHLSSSTSKSAAPTATSNSLKVDLPAIWISTT